MKLYSAKRTKSTLAVVLCINMLGCEDSSQNAPPKPRASGADTYRSCESYEVSQCPSTCYKYSKSGYSQEGCYTSQQGCTDMTKPSACQGFTASTCLWLAGNSKCVDKSSDSCSYRAASDCTTTSSGQKCVSVNNTCTSFSRCEDLTPTDCQFVSGCNKAYDESKTLICTDSDRARELGRINPLNSTLGGGSLGSTAVWLPTAISAVASIAQAFILRGSPQSTFVLGGGVPATYAVPQGGTAAGGAAPSGGVAGLSLDSTTLNNLIASVTVDGTQASRCTKLEKTECDAAYPECGWITEKCVPLAKLDADDVCRGVAAMIDERTGKPDAASSGEIATQEALQRCGAYNRHCSVVNNQECKAK